jgi:hypothetical protein
VRHTNFAATLRWGVGGGLLYFRGVLYASRYSIIRGENRSLFRIGTWNYQHMLNLEVMPLQNQQDRRQYAYIPVWL